MKIREEINFMKKVLVISAHPDDETLGCGGTLLKHKYNNDELYWLIITKANEELGFSKQFLENREKQIDIISEMYGFKSMYIN